MLDSSVFYTIFNVKGRTNMAKERTNTTEIKMVDIKKVSEEIKKLTSGQNNKELEKYLTDNVVKKLREIFNKCVLIYTAKYSGVRNKLKRFFSSDKKVDLESYVIKLEECIANIDALMEVLNEIIDEVKEKGNLEDVKEILEQKINKCNEYMVKISNLYEKVVKEKNKLVYNIKKNVKSKVLGRNESVKSQTGRNNSDVMSFFKRYLKLLEDYKLKLEKLKTGVAELKSDFNNKIEPKLNEKTTYEEFCREKLEKIEGIEQLLNEKIQELESVASDGKKNEININKRRSLVGKEINKLTIEAKLHEIDKALVSFENHKKFINGELNTHYVVNFNKDNWWGELSGKKVKDGKLSEHLGINVPDAPTCLQLLKGERTLDEQKGSANGVPYFYIIDKTGNTVNEAKHVKNWYNTVNNAEKYDDATTEVYAFIKKSAAFGTWKPLTGQDKI